MSAGLDPGPFKTPGHGSDAGTIHEPKQEMVTQGLPPPTQSSTLLLCLHRTGTKGAVKSKTITPKTSVESKNSPRGIAFQRTQGGHRERALGHAEELLFRVCRPEDNDLGEEQHSNWSSNC